ncbi:class I SAM-dependent methyltransferase [Candidatus Sumerlaeota bacterium]|nr:class I SAM-dependent methyltransferase [Candidatus Sumerlaeota bacterium]
MTTEKPKIFTHEYYQRLYDVEEKHWWCRGMRRIAEEIMEPYIRDRAQWRVLDAGCGTGATLDWLRRIGFHGDHFGIDYAMDALRFCHSRRQPLMAQASMLSLPFADNTFDFITCMDVLQHLPLPLGDVEGLREAHRVMRPDGLLLVRSNARRIGDADKSQEVDYRRYSLEELENSLRSAGFDIERITYVNWLDAQRERLKPRKITKEIASTHVDHGLPLRLLPPHLSWMNGLRYAELATEARYLRRKDRSLARGHSTLALARKVGG